MSGYRRFSPVDVLRLINRLLIVIIIMITGMIIMIIS